MNSDSTKHGPYEYDRNSDLIGRSYKMDEELSALLKELEEWEALEDRYEEWASGALALLILVFAGVVLWKVWVG